MNQNDKDAIQCIAHLKDQQRLLRENRPDLLTPAPTTARVQRAASSFAANGVVARASDGVGNVVSSSSSSMYTNGADAAAAASMAYASAFMASSGASGAGGVGGVTTTGSMYGVVGGNALISAAGGGVGLPDLSMSHLAQRPSSTIPPPVSDPKALTEHDIRVLEALGPYEALFGDAEKALQTQASAGGGGVVVVDNSSSSHATTTKPLINMSAHTSVPQSMALVKIVLFTNF